jgi:4-hydroxyacetophenone monooxygenase
LNTGISTDGHPLSATSLAEAVNVADLRVLLMVLYQVSGDRRWLEEPFRPKRDVNLIADETAGFSPEIQAEIRMAAVALLSSTDQTLAIKVPDNDLMVEMMSTCLSEAVPPEYAPMMREQMGFPAEEIDAPASAAVSSAQVLPVVIVGAGASGIALGHRLKQAGISFVVVERNQEVGGTWYENVYPGCAVDTPNHAYSYSFGSRYPWSRNFSPRAEIQDYLEGITDELGLRPMIRFGTRLTGAAWDDGASCWRVTLVTEAGEEHLEALAVVSAIGQISQISLPVLKGAGDYQGYKFHTARWPADMDLKNKHVAIIGTGASAMQIVPEIADDVASLAIYQRSAQWVRPIPRYQDPIPDGGQWLLKNIPLYAAWYRFTMLWRYGDGLLPSLRIDPDWPHPERSLNRANDRHRQDMTRHIEQELEGWPDLIEKCLPTYPPYGKRILLDNSWYKTLRKNNVELITTRIDHLDEAGIETVDSQYRAADVVIYSTGFRMTEMASRLNITGRNGLALAKVWKDENPTAYIGITVPEFPNLFCMQGPNTGLGHGGSAIFQAECQANYIAACLEKIVDDKLSFMEVKPQLLTDYVARVDAEHEQMIWSHPGMSTYYRNKAGRVFSVMPWRLVDYWGMTRTPDFDDYETG